MTCSESLTLNKLPSLVLDEGSIFGDNFIFLVLIETLESTAMRNKVSFEIAPDCTLLYFGTLNA